MLAGVDMSDVQVHYNSSKPGQLNALAYAQGTRIHIAPGQEKHLPHEAWHVAQQKLGRVKPTLQMKSVPVNDDAALEAEADVMGQKIAQGVVTEAHRGPEIQRKIHSSGGDTAQLSRRKRKPRAQKKRERKKRKKKEQAIREFAAQQQWRVWHKNEGPEGGGQAITRTGIPPSTFRIPARLFHVTSYTSLPSIQKTGLDPNFVNQEGGLNASSPENLQYRQRDAALKTVYLGSSERPGISMSSEEDLERGGKITLIIKVPRAFTLAYMRYSSAAGAADVISDEATGDTVLSFALIKPHYIFVNDPRFHEDRCITTYAGNFDWRQLAMPPKGGDVRSLPSFDEIKREKEARLKRLEEFKLQSQQVLSESKQANGEDSSEDKDRGNEEGVGIFSGLDFAKFSNYNNNNDSESEWSD